MTRDFPPSVAGLAAAHGRPEAYAYLDEGTKRNVRRAILKALAIPGWQVPFASREMPVARGWGSGGLQVTLSVVGPTDVVKVIDQGDDHSMNAVGMRHLISTTAQCAETTSTSAATIIQSRHRIPELPLRGDQLLVLQVPHPEPLRRVVADDITALRHHSERDYTPAWLDLYDAQARLGGPRTAADHPVLVAGSQLMSPSPVPRHDVLRMNHRPHPILLGAGRRARLTALPPYTSVEPLAFADIPIEPEAAGGPCGRCGSVETFRVPGESGWCCSDVDGCEARRSACGR
ncbi:alpha-D-ribose 1-methylphosphonate 5-phosphate C-P-lyase PhnJ [Mycolicibacterium hippocampi]|uniref:Carbon-phosphorus lyase complex subunit PhnJ n=1 Tax=Mycolicibacterium hippocampi TaxID=659824 RepID=A0A7I9ZR36_9MYCO|nr:alpha-D-ribose 1-methylphosphonate 5-phosphate C-P-lyase PhnJ [Mycolicibacterium hippocampi]GFH03233.1 carbon-phosphorus lyase complex subunit PhnJ [Mycolicibacterium hippocampi]